MKELKHLTEVVNTLNVVDLEELNEAIEDFSEAELEKLDAILEYYGNRNNLCDMLETIDDMDAFTYRSGYNYLKLAKEMITEKYSEDSFIQRYFDYDKYIDNELIYIYDETSNGLLGGCVL